jgi:hypothetical protein
MKNKAFIPLIFLVVIVFLVSAACNLTGGKETETQEPIVIVVTATPETSVKEPIVTDAPLETVAPTEAPTEEVTEENGAKDFFVEEFDNGLSNYFYFIKSGEEKDVEAFSEDGKLQVTINDYYVYYYLVYDPFTYGDVRLDVEIENYGNNNNEISLICRYDPDYGWYEYNISSGGEWRLFYYDAIVAKDYVRLYNGGSTHVNMGRDTNTYTMICQGNELSLYINGYLARTVEHKDLDRGRIGIAINSYDSYPVIMKVPWLEISQP